MQICRLVLLTSLALASAAPATAQADDRADRRVDRAGEAAVDAELGGERVRSPEPRVRDRRRRARAEPERPPQPVRRRKKPITLGLLLGYGIDLEENFAINPWGIGFGARGGYNVGPLFLGGRFVFYLGEEPSNIWEFGLEAGLDVKSGATTVRPGLGFGLASYVVDDVDSESNAYLAPGLSVLFDLSRDIFVGVDGRVQFILSDPEGLEAIIVLGNLGMRF
jgi:hypothetical protein